MDLREIEATLPPGFRFYPSDEELVCHYLYRKITNDLHKVSKGTMVEVDLHTCEPWQLPDVAKLGANNEWYFFSFREHKYATGLRANRATVSGYWKATGKDRPILNSITRAIVGMRKTLVFYRGRAPNGIKTGWIMHEFRLENIQTVPSNKLQEWVLCRVFQKSKGDLTTKNSFDTHSIGLSSPTFTSSPPPPINQPMHSSGFPANYNSNTLLLNNIAHLNPNLLEIPLEVNNLFNNQSRGGDGGSADEYEFLYTMNLED